MSMNELLQVIVGNPDLPILTVLIIFLLTRVNAIDRKVATISARLDVLEDYILTAMRDHIHEKNKRSNA